MGSASTSFAAASPPPFGYGPESLHVLLLTLALLFLASASGTAPAATLPAWLSTPATPTGPT